MKSMKIKIGVAIIMAFAGMGSPGAAFAESLLYVFPPATQLTPGILLRGSVELSTSENKVCAVEGRVTFANLTCQSITISDGLVPQSAPTCADPDFLIGIPGCAAQNSDITLFTLSLRAGNGGTASLNLSEVEVLGEGAAVQVASRGGDYEIITINEPVVAAPEPTASASPLAENGIRVLTSVEPILEENAQEESLAANILSVFEGGDIWMWLFILILVIFGWYAYTTKKNR